MNRKIFVTVVVIIVLGVSGLCSLVVNQRSESNRAQVELTGDGKGIFVGERRPQHKEGDPSKWSTQTRQRVEDHKASIRAIDESWDTLRRADVYFKNGQYSKAIEAYKKAYEIHSGSQSFFGKELLKAYEKLQQYDEALSLLGELEAEGYYKSDNGVSKVKEIRTRLLAAKEAREDVIS